MTLTIRALIGPLRPRTRSDILLPLQRGRVRALQQDQSWQITARTANRRGYVTRQPPARRRGLATRGSEEQLEGDTVRGLEDEDDTLHRRFVQTKPPVGCKSLCGCLKLSCSLPGSAVPMRSRCDRKRVVQKRKARFRAIGAPSPLSRLVIHPHPAHAPGAPSRGLLLRPLHDDGLRRRHQRSHGRGVQQRRPHHLQRVNHARRHQVAAGEEQGRQ